MEINIDYIEECPICLNNINELDGYLLLTCCDNKVHIRCLDNWYNNNGKKKKICFLCQKESKDLESIIVNSPVITQNIIQDRYITSNRTINKKDIVVIFLLLFICFIIILITLKSI